MVIQTQSLTDDQVDALFKALADATRRDMLRRVLNHDSSISALAAQYEISFPAVHKHLAVLERADLVTKKRHGRESIVRGNPEAIQRVQGLLDRYEQIWRARIDRLDALLAADPTSGAPAGP